MKKVSPGQALEISANDWNRLVDVAGLDLGSVAGPLAGEKTQYVYATTASATKIGAPMSLSYDLSAIPSAERFARLHSPGFVYTSAEKFRPVDASAAATASGYSSKYFHGIAADEADASGRVIRVAVSGYHLARFKNVANRVSFNFLGYKSTSDSDRYDWFDRDPFGPHRLICEAQIDGGGSTDRIGLVELNVANRGGAVASPVTSFSSLSFGQVAIGLPSASDATYNAARLRVWCKNVSPGAISYTAEATAKPVWVSRDSGSEYDILVVTTEWC